MRVNSVDNAKQLTCVRVSAVFLICLACKVYITEENVGVQAVVSTRTHNFVCTGWTTEREREYKRQRQYASGLVLFGSCF